MWPAEVEMHCQIYADRNPGMTEKNSLYGRNSRKPKSTCVFVTKVTVHMNALITINLLVKSSLCISTLQWKDAVVRQSNYAANVAFEINPLDAELNPISHLLALVGDHHILHFSRIRVKDKIS